MLNIMCVYSKERDVCKYVALVLLTHYGIDHFDCTVMATGDSLMMAPVMCRNMLEIC